MEYSFSLENDEQSFFNLLELIRSYYERQGRYVRFLSHTPPTSLEDYEAEFLLDRKHVVRYMVGRDRGINTAGVALAIGPYYFGPADFWSYEASQRFTMEATSEGVLRNLRLLDEFLGCA